MSESAAANETIVWTDGEHAATVARIVSLMGEAVRVIGVGGPRLAEVDRVARDLQCHREDDLRKLLIEHPAAFVLLAGNSGVDAADIATAVQQGAVVLGLEPVTSDLDEVAEVRQRVGSAPGRARLELMPSFLDGAGWQAAAQPTEVIGDLRSLSMSSFGRRGEVSLFARLMDAWLVVLTLTDLPESVDASLAGPLSEVPESLRGLTGHLTAHARLRDGVAAVLHVSDLAGASGRMLHVLGADAHLAVGDAEYALTQADGDLLDRRLPEATVAADLATLASAHWQALLDRPAAPPVHRTLERYADALACCQACTLSSRTGQPESPRKLREMGAA